MKILFLHENSLEESLGVSSMSAVLKAYGHMCDVLIQIAEGRNFFKHIKSYNPDIIAFTCTTGRHVWANKLAGEIKHFHDALFIMGGIHPTIYPEEAIREENINAICVGEGEYPLLELADKLEKKENIFEINNLWFREDRKIYRNPIRNLNDVNLLPYPDRVLYYKYPYNRNITIKRFFAGLGCPFQCSFCHNTLLKKIYKDKGPFVRRKDVTRIIGEIIYIKERVPLTLVHFSDDIFALDKSWLKDFSVEYKSKVGLPFNCNIKMACIDEDTARLLNEAGCNAITFGLESGNEQLRNEIVLKDSTDKEIIEKASLLRRYNIKILSSNMIALPRETIDNVYETIHLNRKIKVEYTRVSMARPFKGTRLFEFAEKNGLLADKALNCANFEVLDNIYFKTDREREFKNLRLLFSLIIKFPILEKPSRLLIKLPLMKIYKLLFLITTVFQEQRFFRAGFLRGAILSRRLIKGFGKNF